MVQGTVAPEDGDELPEDVEPAGIGPPPAPNQKQDYNSKSVASPGQSPFQPDGVDLQSQTSPQRSNIGYK